MRKFIQQFVNLLSLYWLTITVVLIVIISALSLAPLDQLPPAPGSDKLHHLIAYAALSLPLSLRKPKYWWLIAVFFVAYSGLIEIVQPYVNRYGDWSDLLANSIGVVLGIFIAELLSSIFPARLKLSDK